MKKMTFLLFITLNFALLKSSFSQEITLSAVQSTNWSWASSDNASSISEPENITLNTPEWATATCFCKVSYNNLTNQQAGTGICLDLTGVVNKTYSGVTPMSEANRNDCNVRCTNVTAALTTAQKQSIADCVCAAGIATGTPIRSYSAVGTKDYKSSHQIGILTNTAEVANTICKCPIGWLSDTNVDGGVTNNGVCKKLVCGPWDATAFPPPNPGVVVGTWGFTWQNQLWAFGTTANKGAVVCSTVILTPKVCKIQ